MENGYRYSSLVMIMVGLLVNIEVALAEQHVVGGSQGWDESTDFNSWASGQTFKVGDQLVFKYSPGLHSVVELGSESEYKKCNIGSAVNSLSGGNNVVKLDKSGTRYFACGTSGHCDQGMKIKVTTLTADETNSSSTPSSLPTSSAPIFLSLSSLFFMVLLVMINFFGGYFIM